MSSYAGTYNSGSRGTEVLTSIVMIIVLFAGAFVVELLYKMATDKELRFKTLLDVTASSDENIPPVRQDLSKFKDAIPIGLSVNERTGIEFSYSFYLFVNSSTFTGEQKLRHVWHKGFTNPWPLMGPGVFIHGHTNTMRVFMNTHKNPYTYVDIKNIPVQKWFHVVLNCYKGGLDVYINGNLANRLSFKDTIPYQNYQDILFFSKSNYENIRSPTIAALPEGESMAIQGSFSGMLASMKYARYAMSVFEINKLMSQGPSSKRRTVVQELPPYFSDTWWSNQSP